MIRETYGQKHLKKVILSLIKKNRIVEKTSRYIYRNTIGKTSVWLRRKRLKKYGLTILTKIDNIFKELNKDYWIDFGTLLGAYRDKDFIDHDTDIDIGMFLKDYDNMLDLIFAKYGFKKIREINIDDGLYGKEITYQYKNVNVDIFFYTRINEDYAYCHDFICLDGFDFFDTIKIKGGLIPREIMLPLHDITYINFKGRKFPAPSPIEEHLRARYGENFMIKDPNWKWDKYYNKNIRILHDKIGVIKT